MSDQELACGPCDERRAFVLFADDDPLTLKALCEGAARRGICADTASTAREILDKVNLHCGAYNDCYSAVVADVNYFDAQGSRTHLTGITAGEQIRRAYPDLPLLYVTGFASAMVRAQIRKQGAALMEKPFDIEDLLDRVEYLIQMAGSNYQGPEQRQRSINHSGYTRRRTDKPLAVPQAVENSLTQARVKAQRH